MKISFKFLLMIVWLAGWVGELPAQSGSCQGSECQGSRGVLFVIPINPVTNGMGRTQSGQKGDPLMLFTNPAVLSGPRGWNAALSRSDWIADISRYGAGLAFGISEKQTLGISLAVLHYGKFTAYNPEDSSHPWEVRYGNREIGIGYAYRPVSWLSLGTRLWSSQDVQNGELPVQYNLDILPVNSDYYLYTDVGMLFEPKRLPLEFGAVIRSMSLYSGPGPLFNYREEVDLGLAVDVFSLVAEQFNPEWLQLMVAYDWIKPQERDSRQNLGLEALVANRLFLRTGRRFGYELQKYSAGLGLNIPVGPVRLRADYAYLDMDMFDDIHLFSVGIGL